MVGVNGACDTVGGSGGGGGDGVCGEWVMVLVVAVVMGVVDCGGGYGGSDWW